MKDLSEVKKHPRDGYHVKQKKSHVVNKRELGVYIPKRCLRIHSDN